MAPHDRDRSRLHHIYSSILEAAAAGTPTVAYEVPGVEDAIENGLNGLKIKNGDRKGAGRVIIFRELQFTVSVEMSVPILSFQFSY